MSHYTIGNSTSQKCFFNQSLLGTSLYWHVSATNTGFYVQMYMPVWDLMKPTELNVLKGTYSPQCPLLIRLRKKFRKTNLANLDTPGERQKTSAPAICCVIGIDQQPHQLLRLYSHFLLRGQGNLLPL